MDWSRHPGQALATAACGNGNAASGGDWPNAGQARAQLTARYGYAFKHVGSNWEVMTGGLSIDLPDQDDFVDEMSVTVYNAPAASYQTDIDQVFSVIAPSAEDWSHQQIAASATSDSLNTQTTVTGGTVKFSWDKSVPVLAFNFDGNAQPRQSS